MTRLIIKSRNIVTECLYFLLQIGEVDVANVGAYEQAALVQGDSVSRLSEESNSEPGMHTGRE